jgi:hypothetical protein
LNNNSSIISIKAKDLFRSQSTDGAPIENEGQKKLFPIKSIKLQMKKGNSVNPKIPI